MKNLIIFLFFSIFLISVVSAIENQTPLEQCNDLLIKQQQYIHDLNATIDRKNTGIAIVNNNINYCQKERIKMRNYFIISISILIITLVVILIKNVMRKK